MRTTKDYAYLLYEAMMGDDSVEYWCRLMKEDGFIDEDGEWIYKEDEE